MSFSPSDSQIYGTLFSDPDLAEIFSDKGLVARWVDVEIALAKVQGDLGVIPAHIAAEITTKAREMVIDFDALSAGTEKAGVPIMALVRQIREQISPEAAPFVHWGATTQDIMDTALILQTRNALAILEARLQNLTQNLARMADQHRQTLMAGRTHSQQALPIPFGLKVATWLAPLIRHRQRLNQLRPRLLVIQFGGAAGTLAALGDQGIRVQEALAAELELGSALIPWHSQRDALAELASWLSLLSGSLAKMGQDIILLAQTEIGELRESNDPSRGGSSTMPQKSNPILSEVIIAAHRSNAALVSAMHQALVQEHERATHGWQLEWLSLPQTFALTATALNKALFLSQNLVVDVARMRQNVAASHGLMLAEAANFALTEHMDRLEAQAVIKAAIAASLVENRHLIDVLRDRVSVPVDWDRLRDERAYFGMAGEMIDRVLAEVNE